MVGDEVVHQAHISLGLGVPDIGVLPQDAAQVSAGHLARVAQDVVGQLERSVLPSVGFHGAGHIVVSRTQGPRPEYVGRLQGLVAESGEQQHREDGGNRIPFAARPQCVDAEAQNDPEEYGEGTLLHSIPVASAHQGGHGNRQTQRAQLQTAEALTGTRT